MIIMCIFIGLTVVLVVCTAIYLNKKKNQSVSGQRNPLTGTGVWYELAQHLRRRGPGPAECEPKAGADRAIGGSAAEKIRKKQTGGKETEKPFPPVFRAVFRLYGYRAADRGGDSYAVCKMSRLKRDESIPCIL